MLSRRALAGIEALKQRRIVEIDFSYTTAGIRNVAAVRKLAEALYPGQVPVTAATRAALLRRTPLLVGVLTVILVATITLAVTIGPVSIRPVVVWQIALDQFDPRIGDSELAAIRSEHRLGRPASARPPCDRLSAPDLQWWVRRCRRC